MDFSENEWETLKEFEDYEINKNYPYPIRRKDTKQVISERVSGDKRYIKTNLRKNKIRFTINKHRLIASQWIHNPYNLPQVDHIDHDKTNNRIENLRWVSSSDNNRNRQKANKVEYIFSNELPNTAEPLTEYGKYKFDNLFVDYANKKLYKQIASNLYRELVIYEYRHDGRFAVRTSDNIKTSISFNVLFK